MCEYGTIWSVFSARTKGTRAEVKLDCWEAKTCGVHITDVSEPSLRQHRFVPWWSVFYPFTNIHGAPRLANMQQCTPIGSMAAQREMKAYIPLIALQALQYPWRVSHGFTIPAQFLESSPSSLLYSSCIYIRLSVNS